MDNLLGFEGTTKPNREKLPRLTRKLIHVPSEGMSSVVTWAAKREAAARLAANILSQDDEERVLILGMNGTGLAMVGDMLTSIPDVEVLLHYHTFEHRQRAVDRFLRGATRVLVMPTSSTVGLAGFQKVCRHVVFLEMGPTPEHHIQAEGRIYRAGGPWEEVFSHILVSDDAQDRDDLRAMGKVWLSLREEQIPGLSPSSFHR